MRQSLPEELSAYAIKSPARFHMPGHKGRGMGGFFSPELIGWDITELSVSDDLHNPQKGILEAQMRCAEVYGAKNTFFLVNGSTSGIHAMMAYLPPKSALCIARDCHKSVLTGAAIYGHSCRFVEPAYHAKWNIFGCISKEALERELQTCNADAVVITSPNYYGLCADLEGLSAVAKKHGALLFVDAAHGAHFPFSSSLPITPAAYADAWVNSAHKTLNALGQTAFLHIGRSICKENMQRTLSMLQTSSPSYLLLSSLDWARYTASLSDAWSICAKQTNALKKRIEGILGLHVLQNDLIGQSGIADMDATRIVIDVHERGITGYQAQKSLEACGVFVEMADYQRLVCICTPADDKAWYPKLEQALCALPYGKDAKKPPSIHYAPKREIALPLSKAMRAPIQSCALKDAAGRIAADPVGLYPPGIPCFMPGERILEEDIAYLFAHQKLGASLFNVRDQEINFVK